jgi:hypothetical protein
LTRFITSPPKDNARIINTIFVCFVWILLVLITHTKAQGQGITNNKSADSFDIKKVSFQLPQPLPKGKYYHAISIIHVIIPKDWTLDVINAPMFSYEGKYTLPHGFNIQASLATLFISYRLLLGPFWNYTFGNNHIGAGYQVAYNYGFLNEFGFNSKVAIWEQQPSILLGHSFKNTALTLRGNLNWTTAIYQYQGGHVVPSTNSFINGYGASATYEQRIRKKKIMFVGAKANYIRYHIIAWPAFPVNQYRYWVPEIQVGLVL